MGRIYKKVLELSKKNDCNYFEFCIRHDIDFSEDGSYQYSENAYRLIKELEPFLIAEKPTNSWVTGLIIAREDESTLYRYRFDEHSLAKLLKYSNAMNDWCGPKLPEDLVLFQNEKPWLGFVGHEEMSFWFLTKFQEKEVAELGLELFNGEE
ncbi:hypothetical protein [Enterococcus sp. AZ126]|uniref:hypothetical protein n=1 Tax=Enterococcus sp. AZ126 TaxID=2774635 RepID=UPI003F2450D7